MSDKYYVEVTSDARRELRGIYDYIAKSSPQNASSMVVRLLDAMQGLELLPHRFDVPRTRYSRGRSIRVPEWPYIIRYQIDERRKMVFVMHVRHGARRKP